MIDDIESICQMVEDNYAPETCLGRLASAVRTSRALIAAEREAHGKTQAERHDARCLIDEMIDRIDRIESYEELRGLTRCFRNARNLSATGKHDEAVALLRAGMEDEP